LSKDEILDNPSSLLQTDLQFLPPTFSTLRKGELLPSLQTQQISKISKLDHPGDLAPPHYPPSLLPTMVSRRFSQSISDDGNAEPELEQGFSSSLIYSNKIQELKMTSPSPEQ
jgi:hypothetical protein